jgi:surface antigen
MAFAYWCVDKAAREAKVANPLHKTGGVMAQWNAMRGTGHRVSTPRRGDLFVMSFGRGLGHIGFVERVQGDRIMTIEGNSNDEGSREGHEVCRKPGGRAISSCIGFIRLTQ